MNRLQNRLARLRARSDRAHAKFDRAFKSWVRLDGRPEKLNKTLALFYARYPSLTLRAMKHRIALFEFQLRLTTYVSARCTNVHTPVALAGWKWLGKAKAAQGRLKRFVLGEVAIALRQIAQLLSELHVFLLCSGYSLQERRIRLLKSTCQLQELHTLTLKHVFSLCQSGTVFGRKSGFGSGERVADGAEQGVNFHEGSSVNGSSGVGTDESMAEDVPHPPSVKQSHKQDRPC
jgi:hypothetical protein